MSDEQMGNNRVYIKGEVVSELSYSHEVHGERFYIANICTSRNSGSRDVVPFMVSEKLMSLEHDYNGCVVSINGQFQSYNPHGVGWRKLELFVFVHEVEFLRGEFADNRNNNRILLNGVICKEPIYRKTPLGREITDVFLAVNRSYGKADYIPCIVWGRNAIFAARLKVGNVVNIQGRIQSREYVKWLSEEEKEMRIAYEVSASTLELREA